jgi:hypothetical protein
MLTSARRFVQRVVGRQSLRKIESLFERGGPISRSRALAQILLRTSVSPQTAVVLRIRRLVSQSPTDCLLVCPHFGEAFTKTLRVDEPRGDDELASSIDEPRTSIEPGGGEALRELPRNVKRRGNDDAAFEINESVFSLDDDREQAIWRASRTGLLPCATPARTARRSHAIDRNGEVQVSRGMMLIFSLSIDCAPMSMADRHVITRVDCGRQPPRTRHRRGSGTPIHRASRQSVRDQMKHSVGIVPRNHRRVVRCDCGHDDRLCCGDPDSVPSDCLPSMTTVSAVAVPHTATEKCV